MIERNGNMQKLTKMDLIQLNKFALEFFYSGYNLSFMHGWFCSYLSSPSDAEEDMVIPTYLILDEDKITDEKRFSKFIDELMALYSGVADNIFERNKQIKPLVNLAHPNDFDINNLDQAQKKNLFLWLYGYMCGYLVIGTDITEYCHNEQLLENKFYPALYNICSAFLLLEQEIAPESFFTDSSLEDYLDVKADILDMWEKSEDGRTFLDELKVIKLIDVLANFVEALNIIFYVVRVSDESRFTENK